MAANAVHIFFLFFSRKSALVLNIEVFFIIEAANKLFSLQLSCVRRAGLYWLHGCKAFFKFNMGKKQDSTLKLINPSCCRHLQLPRVAISLVPDTCGWRSRFLFGMASTIPAAGSLWSWEQHPGLLLGHLQPGLLTWKCVTRSSLGSVPTALLSL